MNESQKATCALTALPFLKEEAKARQQLHGGTAPGKNGKTLPQKIGEVSKHDNESTAQAAKLFGTNRQYVADAEKIEKENPKYLEKIKSGELTIPKAKEQIKAESRKKTLNFINF